MDQEILKVIEQKKIESYDLLKRAEQVVAEHQQIQRKVATLSAEIAQLESNGVIAETEPAVEA